jgi:flavorubredoxin
MKETFTAQKVAENIYWVGAIDWKIRDFHGYATHRGTTYNAYLVMTDKITLIDTVKAPFLNQLMSRIASVVDPTRIDYIVSNHSEMDHTGCLPKIIDMVKPEKVFASPMGVKTIAKHFDTPMNIDAVKDGDTLDLGNATLNFLETRMLHWPDSMLTYMPEQEFLFSQDGFGMHLASSERFDDEISDWLLEDEASKYFANILLPFSAQVAKVLERVTKLGISIKTIAPDHGPIWRKDPMKIINLYSKWAKQEATKKAVIVYDTMWESTATMAHAVGDGIIAEGMQIKMVPLSSSHRSDLATELLDAGALIVGSPTMNNNLFPTVADALTYVKGLRPKNLIGGTFGSYGWSGEAISQVNEMLRAMKIELVSEGVKSNYVPTDEVLAECHALGVTVARRVKEKFFTE